MSELTPLSDMWGSLVSGALIGLAISALIGGVGIAVGGDAVGVGVVGFCLVFAFLGAIAKMFYNLGRKRGRKDCGVY